MATSCCRTHEERDAFNGYLHSGVSRFPVECHTGPSFRVQSHTGRSSFPSTLVVQPHIPFRLLQPDSCLPALVSSAWQAVIIPLYCTVLSLADMVFPHLLLRWLWRPMIGYEKTLSPRQTLPVGQDGWSVHLPVPPSFRAIRGPPVQTVDITEHTCHQKVLLHIFHYVLDLAF